MQKHVIQRGALYTYFFYVHAARARQVHQCRHGGGAVIRRNVYNAVAVRNTRSLREALQLFVPIRRCTFEFRFECVVAGTLSFNFVGVSKAASLP